MQTVHFTERTGKDGVLQVRIPLGQPDADFDVVVVVKPKCTSGSSNEADDEAWTDEKNSRRCLLIDRKLQGSLSDDEAIELDWLQRIMRRHLSRVAPLPIEGAMRLHAELLSKQQSAD